MHYLELDAEGRFVGVFPLEQEIANTEFYDGTLLFVPATMDFPPAGMQSLSEWLAVTDPVTEPSLVHIYRLIGISPSTPEFGTDNGGRDCHIQRL
ncbi:MAG: hypothetical protein LUD46_09520 [Parabacteroides sp.]|nr:hypothetical protein [Parabacteroides sp.]